MQSRKSLLAKIFGAFCALLCVIALAFGLAACDSNSDTVKSVVGMSVENGQLVLEYSDGSTETIDLGDLKGDTGDTGATGPQGPEGPQGDAGRGIVSVAADENGNLVITYTDGTTQTVEMPAASDEDCEHAHISWYKLDGYAYIATTNTYEGTLLEVCDDCGYAWLWKNEEHVGHHVWKEVPAEDPTCCAPGHTAGTVCEVCGVYGENTEEIPATGNHVWDEGHLVYSENENVCEQGGVYIYLCETEGCEAYYINEDEEVRGHEVSTWSVEKAPTATAAGNLVGICTVCGEPIRVTLPALTDANVYNAETNPNGVYTKEQISNLDNDCELATDYRYTYTLVAGTELTIPSQVGLEANTTVEYTGTAAYTANWTVNVPGGYHYTLNMFGEEEAIEIVDHYAMIDAEKGILWYPGIQVFGNITYNCQDWINDDETASAVFFDCEHCGEHIYTRVTGYHVVDGELVTSIDDPAVEYHEATCSSAPYYSVDCDICGEVVIRACGIEEHETNKTHYDADAHQVPDDVTITDAEGNTIDPEAIEVGDVVTIEYTCELCGKDQKVSGTVKEVTEHGDDPSTPCTDASIDVTVSYEVNDETYEDEVNITLVNGTYHSVTVNGVTYSLSAVIDPKTGVSTISIWTGDGTDEDDYLIRNEDTITSDSPVASILEFFGNVPETCEDRGFQAFIDCGVCDTHLLVYYQIAHTATLNAQGAIDYTLAGCSAPTCMADGVALCSVCGENFTVEDSALGHNYVVVDATYNPAQTGNNFTAIFYCTRGDVGTQAQPAIISGNYDELVEDGYIVPNAAPSCGAELIIDIVNYPVPQGGVINAEDLNLGVVLDHHWDMGANSPVLDASLTTVYNIDEYTGFIEFFGNVPVNCQDNTGYGFTYCRDCDMRVLIRVSGHHTPGATPVVAQSHSTAAIYQCVDCGTYFYVGTPAQHTWTMVEGSVEVPTRTEVGHVTYQCTCGATQLLEIPMIGSTGLTYTTNKDCEHGTTNTYSATLTFSVTVVSHNELVARDLSTPFNYTVDFYYEENLGDAGHDAYVEGTTVVYSWIYPEDEDGTVYVGYICSTCGDMIVLWHEGMVDENGLPVQNTYDVDVYLDSLIPGVAYPGSVEDVNRMLPSFADGLYGEGISAVFAADGTGYFVADGDPETATQYAFTWTYTEAGLVISSDVDMSAIGITISATPVAVTYGTTARGLEYYAFTYSGIEFSQVIDPELEGEPENPGTEDPGTEEPEEPETPAPVTISMTGVTVSTSATENSEVVWDSSNKTPKIDGNYYIWSESGATLVILGGDAQWKQGDDYVQADGKERTISVDLSDYEGMKVKVTFNCGSKQEGIQLQVAGDASTAQDVTFNADDQYAPVDVSFTVDGGSIASFENTTQAVRFYSITITVVE